EDEVDLKSAQRETKLHYDTEFNQRCLDYVRKKADFIELNLRLERIPNEISELRSGIAKQNVGTFHTHRDNLAILVEQLEKTAGKKLKRAERAEIQDLMERCKVSKPADQSDEAFLEHAKGLHQAFIEK